MKFIKSKNIKLFVCLALMLNSIALFTQESDAKLNTLLSVQDYSSLKKQYIKLQKKATIPMQLYSKAILYSYFNQPIEANETILALLQKYPDWLSAQHQLSFALMLADNEVKMQNYKNAASIYAQLIQQLSPYWDSVSIAPYKQIYKLYSVIENVPRTEVLYPQKTAQIDYAIDSAGLFTVAINHNKNLNFILDLGAGLSMIEQKYVNMLNIRKLSDSIVFENLSGDKILGQLGVADSIKLDDIIIKNVLFLITPNKIIGEDIHPVKNYEIKGIIGLPVIKAMEKVKFSKGKMTISASSSNYGKQSNLMMFSSYLFIITTRKEGHFCFHFDTGSPKSHLNFNFCTKANEDINKLKKESVTRLQVGRCDTVITYLKPNYYHYIGKKKCSFSNINIEATQENLAGLNIDGRIGKDIILNNRNVVIDFKKMICRIR